MRYNRLLLWLYVPLVTLGASVTASMDSLRYSDDHATHE